MFNRTEEENLYSESVDIIPLIVQYLPKNEERHNKRHDIPFQDFISAIQGVHDVVVVNRGINESNSKQELEISIVGTEYSFKAIPNIEDGYVFRPIFDMGPIILPQNENEFIRRKCNLIFTKIYSPNFLNENGLFEKYDIIKAFIEECSSMNVAYDDSKLGQKNKEAWKTYSEGRNILNKEKQNLLRIKSVSTPHPKKMRKGNATEIVVDVCLDVKPRSELFVSELNSSLNSMVEGKHKIEFQDGDTCIADIAEYRIFGDANIDKLNEMAKKHCFTLDEEILHYITGTISLKQDNDFEGILKEVEQKLSSFSESFKREGSRFICQDERIADYLVRILNSDYSDVLSSSIDNEIAVAFASTSSDFTEEIKLLVSAGINERDIREKGNYLSIQTWKDPLDMSILSECKTLTFDHCNIRYTTKGNDSFESSKQFDDMETVVLPNVGGYYEGVVYSSNQIKEKARLWQKQIRDYFGTSFKAQKFYYIFRKSADIELLRNLQSEVFFDNPKVRIAATRSKVTFSPDSKSDYLSLIQDVKSHLTPQVILKTLPYSVTVDVCLAYEEEMACQRLFNKIRNGLLDVESFIKLEQRGVDYTNREFVFNFTDEVDLTEKKEQLYRALDKFKKQCTLSFSSENGNTQIIFSRDPKAEKDFEESWRAFYRENVKVVTKEDYETINREIDYDSQLNELIEEKERAESHLLQYSRKKCYTQARKKYHSEISRLNEDIHFARKAKRSSEKAHRKEVAQILMDSTVIGECCERTYDTVTISLPAGFDRKSHQAHPILKVGNYLYFPFSGNSSEIYRQKNALDRLNGERWTTNNPPVNPLLSRILFNPRYAHDVTSEEIETASNWIRQNKINPQELEDKQIEAIAKACSCKDIAFIQGPPGTGKTTVIAEIIWKIINQHPEYKILLTSQNNLAVDNALERLKDARGIHPVRVLNTFARDIDDAEDKEGYKYMLSTIASWQENPNDRGNNAVNHWINTVLNSLRTGVDYIKYREVLSDWETSLERRDSSIRDSFARSYVEHVNLLAATCSYCASSGFSKTYQELYKSQKVKFDVVIMDEASKATLPEMAVPMVNGRTIILIGDHRQLPPILSSEHKEAFKVMGKEDLFEQSYEELKTSHFGLMFKEAQRYVPNIIATLTTQYRMHKQIMNTINQFYKRDVEGGLKCGIESTMDINNPSEPGSRWHGLSFDRILSPDIHALWIDVRGEETPLNPGYKNMTEVEAVENVIKMLVQSNGYKEYLDSMKRDEDKEIGVITFYSGQKNALRSRKFDPSNTYRISAVDKFQGMERNIVIVSTVRSNSNSDIGFARESERINVAFSRAKRLLIVVGNKKLFSRFEDYKESIENMKTVDYRTLKSLIK